MHWPAMGALYPALAGWLDSRDVDCVETALMTSSIGIGAAAAVGPEPLVSAGIVDKLTRFTSGRWWSISKTVLRLAKR
jgi:hypothetical protein